MAKSGSFEFSWAGGNWNPIAGVYHCAGTWTRNAYGIYLSNVTFWQSPSYGTAWGSMTDTGVHVNNGSAYTTTLTMNSSGKETNHVNLADGSISLSTSTTSATIYCYVDDEPTGSQSISFDAWSTNPAVPSVSLYRRYENGAEITVSLSSYGNPSGASGRYIEAGISTTNDYMGSTRWLKHASNVSQATLSVRNSGIRSNTLYYFGGYADNTELHSYTPDGALSTFVTLASQPIATNFSVSGSTATFVINETSSGTARPVQLQYAYKKNQDSSWSKWTNAGSARNKQSETVTLSNLQFSNYDVKVRSSFVNSGSESYITTDEVIYTNAFSTYNPIISVSNYSLGFLASDNTVPVTVNLLFSGASLASETYNVRMIWKDEYNNTYSTNTVQVAGNLNSHSFIINPTAKSTQQTIRITAYLSIGSMAEVSSSETSAGIPSNLTTAPSISYTWDNIRKNLSVTTTKSQQSAILIASNYTTSIYKRDASNNRTLMYNWSGSNTGTQSKTINIDPEEYPTLVIESVQHVQYGSDSSTTSTAIQTPYVIRGRIIPPSGSAASIVRIKIKDTNGVLHDGDYQHPFVIK